MFHLRDLDWRKEGYLFQDMVEVYWSDSQVTFTLKQVFHVSSEEVRPRTALHIWPGELQQMLCLQSKQTMRLGVSKPEELGPKNRKRTEHFHMLC
jgi:hypothetical protein